MKHPDDRPIDERDLHAYVDGELDARRRLQVETWLAGHPRDAARVADYRRIRERLHRRYDPVLTESPPEAAAVPCRDAGTLARVAAVAGLMLVSGLFGWSLRGAPGVPVQADLVRPAAFAHRVYSTDPRRPVEIPGGDRQSLNRWVSQRMHTELRAPDLSGQGLRLIGGRLLPSTDRMAAQFMYETADGRRVTVYVRRIAAGRAGSEFHYREQDGLHVFYWMDAEMGYAVIGSEPAARLIGIAGAVRRAFDGRG